MKISIHSDLHLEREKAKPFNSSALADADVYVFPGDINKLSKVPDFLFDVVINQQGKKAIYVPGNHDYWGTLNMDFMESDAKESAEIHPNIHFLQCDKTIIDGVRFLGCTLWSDFSSMGEDHFFDALETTKHYPDFKLIGIYGIYRFSQNDCIALHRKHLAWLESELNNPFDGKTVVITHFAPSMILKNKSVIRNNNQKIQKALKEGQNEIAELLIKGKAASAYFNNSLDDLIIRTKPDLWVFAHTHYNIDTYIGTTRVISNQAGYEHESIGYNPELIVEV